jgi:hypothetical protein
MTPVHDSKGLQILGKVDLLSPEHPAVVLAGLKHFWAFGCSKDTEHQQKFANVICATVYTRSYLDEGCLNVNFFQN